MAKRNYVKLAASIVIDVIGFASYLIPGLAEVSDVLWAPISAVLIFFLYGTVIGGMLGFAEEISPGLDFIPTATILWFMGGKK